MASRIAASSLRAAVRQRAAPALAASMNVRVMSSNPPPPSERATEIINKFPSSPGIITKTGTALLATGAIATAISQELYVVNEESVLLIGSIILFTYLGKILREPYMEWANGHIKRIKDALEGARRDHTQTVKERIDSVEQMKDVVSMTKALFAMSKETAELEASAFVQQQKVAMAAELKSVLDSWVRYEQQLKENEQAVLTKTVIDNVLKSLADERMQGLILMSAVAEVEQLVKNKAI